MDKLTNNAIESAKGNIYQIYMSLLYCRDLNENETIFFERFGDITVSGEKQIEVKKYSEPLNDNHINIWKTLKNWLQDYFEPTHYKKLILLTTQEYGVKSTLLGWNEKSPSQKYNILHTIFKDNQERHKKIEKEKHSTALKFMKYIFDNANHEKLITILDRFLILDSSPLLPQQYKTLLATCAPGIVEKNKPIYINSLLGFILSPDIVENSNGWSVTYNQLEEERVLLNSLLCKDTVIFPKKHFENKISINPSDFKDKLFVRKIEDIGYTEVILQAKNDYIKTCNTICDEFRNGIRKNRLDYYQEDIINQFRIKHRLHKRKAGTDILKESLSFYDEINGENSTAMDGFHSTPRDFKNGVIHIHMDDDNNDIKWSLK